MLHEFNVSYFLSQYSDVLLSPMYTQMAVPHAMPVLQVAAPRAFTILLCIRLHCATFMNSLGVDVAFDLH